MESPPRQVVVAAILCLALALAGCGSEGLETHATTGQSRPTASTAHFRFFSPTGFWNAPPPPDAPLDPSSATLAGALASEAEAEQADRSGPWIGTTRYSVPIYTVGAEQPTVRVQLTSQVFSPALQAAFERVPLPPAAQPSGGTDGHLVVWQPATDRLWEFWRLVRTESGAQASWGGAMQNVSSDSGAYGPEAWPHAEPWWGASASSLSIAGGLITLEDLKLGEINHALAEGTW